MKGLVDRLRRWAKTLKRQIILLWLCCRDPQMPWLPRLVGLAVVGYAISPIDLIPDFIPVLGFLDDVLLLPLGITLVLQLTPTCIIERCRPEAERKADARIQGPGRWLVAGGIVLLWIGLLALVWRALAS